MPSEEIRVTVEVAVREGLQFPWWSYILALHLSMVPGATPADT